jgi:hypothetical protein
MKRNTWGQGQNSVGLGQVGADQNGAILVSNSIGAVGLPAVGMAHQDGISFELTTAAGTRTIVVTATDNVVAALHTWTFANGAFTADDVGGTLTVSGATNANNNATVTIASVTNATTIVTGGTQTNETFTTPTNLAVTSTGLTISAGVWTIEASNTYAQGELNAPDAAGNWFDVTASFTAITAVTGNQGKFTMSSIARFSARAVRPKLTLSAAGRTRANAFAMAKGTA